MAQGPRIAHVGIAVPDLEQALAFYRDILGLTPHAPEAADGATILSLPFGETEVELLAPDSPDGPIAKFLARRGAGIHHICYRVPDLDTALAACRRAGYRLMSRRARRRVAGRAAAQREIRGPQDATVPPSRGA